ncbi:MAG TPA: HD domain-containing phosphohydrolase, partial [Thermoleophilia bacterium]|nr:HD domain-containing phosphohydrolase [Thermoleophilia bacterium]
MLKWDEKTCLTVPLIVGDEVMGLLVLIETHAERHFNAGERELAQALADQAAAAFHNARLYREQEEQNRRLASLLDAGRAMTSSLVVEDVLAAMARKAAEAVGAPECVIYEYLADDDAIVMRSDWVAPGSGLSAYPHLGDPIALADWPDDRRTLLEGRPVQRHLDDPDLDGTTRTSMSRWGQSVRLSVPFSFGNEPLGFFVIIDTAADRVFTDEEIELVEGIGEQAAAAVHNAELYRQVQQRQRETELLNEIARKITSSLRVDEIADVSLSELRKLVPFDRGSVVLLDERGLLTTVLATDGRRVFDGEPLETVSADVLERLRAERVMLLTLPAESPFVADDPLVEGLSSLAVVGLFAEGELMAALTLGREQSGAFGEHDRTVLRRVGTHLSLALGNAHLYENIRRLHLNNLKALSSALSAKDYYTLGHAARVAAYMVLLGNELGWPSELIAEAEEAAYLHDIGKIAISDRVLLKPSRLNAREWELMRQHPSFSADIISALFGPEAVAAVRHHHESFDGGGYPDGLVGDDIPELAQAMCIVDSYDAMSSWRPYRAAMSYADCLAELERCRGRQFAPRMVEALRRVLDSVATRHTAAGVVAREAAAAIDVTALRRVLASGGADRAAHERVAAALRAVRDAHPPTRYLTAIVPAHDGSMMIAVDAEEDVSRRSPYGETILADDELQATF